jgi:UDP-N-acetylglucosamine diphosphorylase/glucosamine-1-phosphate N-acetyltransferase
MTIVLFDEEVNWKNLLPFTFTRPVSEIRIGILTIREKWERALNSKASYRTQSYLNLKFPLQEALDQVIINSSLCANPSLTRAISQLKAGEGLYANDLLIAFRGSLNDWSNRSTHKIVKFSGHFLQVKNVWDIFQKNGEALLADFELITKGRISEPLSKTLTVIGDPSLIFLEKGASAEACIINTKAGPVYLGEDSEIMEGSVIRGPLALCEHSALKLSTKVYGASTVGPHSKVGGELSNSVIFGYSNKAHDGFLGNSVLGEWCNLGADTNNSNLKNNYGPVKLYNYANKGTVNTGLQFCGLMMGDHSKAGINTMFNTGTVVGVGCNIFGGGFPATHIPDFSWGGASGFEKYQLEKLVETATKMYERRGLAFGSVDHAILKHLFDQTN